MARIAAGGVAVNERERQARVRGAVERFLGHPRPVKSEFESVGSVLSRLDLPWPEAEADEAPVGVEDEEKQA